MVIYFYEIFILFIFIYLMTFQVKANEPDLSMFDTSLQQDIRSACNLIKYTDGLVPYFECIEENKKEIIAYGKRPDLSMFDIDLQRDIKTTCQLIKYNEGLIANFECINKNKKEIIEFGKIPNLSNFDNLLQTEIKRSCGLIKYTDGIIPYFNCLKEEKNKIEKSYVKDTENQDYERLKNYLKDHICNLDQPIEFLKKKKH